MDERNRAEPAYPDVAWRRRRADSAGVQLWRRRDLDYLLARSLGRHLQSADPGRAKLPPVPATRAVDPPAPSSRLPSVFCQKAPLRASRARPRDTGRCPGRVAGPAPRRAAARLVDMSTPPPHTTRCRVFCCDEASIAAPARIGRAGAPRWTSSSTDAYARTTPWFPSAHPPSLAGGGFARNRPPGASHPSSTCLTVGCSTSPRGRTA